MMSSCGRAFLWQFWQRYPWVTFGGGIYLAVLAVAHVFISPDLGQ